MAKINMFDDSLKALEKLFVIIFPELEAMAKRDNCSVTQCVTDIVEQEVMRERRRKERSSEGNIFQFVKEQVDIVDMIDRYIEVSDVGDAEYKKADCPFCDPEVLTPHTLNISPSKGVFYCFHCHIGGDAISFLARYKKITPIGAAEFLIQRYELQVPEEYKNQLKS